MTEVIRSASRARKTLASLGLPFTDEVPVSSSERRFETGAAWGVEVPAINSLRQLEATIKALREAGVYCTRFDETHGSHLLSNAEISEMLAACRQGQYGIMFGIGPRPEYDIKASFYRTPFGLEQGRQLNNHDAYAQAIEEAFRLCELGCRGITVYDIGVLKTLKELRHQSLLPAELKLKTSSHCMATNAVIARIFSDLGADSITTAHDLSLPVLQEMRRLCPDTVLDVPTDVYKSKGGYIRWYELAEIVQACAPVFLKMGASVQDDPYSAVGTDSADTRAQRIKVGLEVLHRALPAHLTALKPRDPLVCVPVMG